MTDAKQDFWDRIDGVQAGMLGLTSDGELVPMSPNLREERDGKIWFITSTQSDLPTKLGDVAMPARFVVADAKSGLYTNLEGTLELVDDSQVLEEVWSVIAGAWFEDGKQDEDVQLMAFTPKMGGAWFSSTNPARFVYEIAKAHATGSQPDTGYEATLQF